MPGMNIRIFCVARCAVEYPASYKLQSKYYSVALQTDIKPPIIRVKYVVYFLSQHSSVYPQLPSYRKPVQVHAKYPPSLAILSS